jgi:hypothetical protein
VQQLALTFPPRRTPPRALQPIDRLQAVLKRRGFDPQWRQHPGDHKRGWLLPLPCLGVDQRLALDPLWPDRGIPATGAYETLCGWHVNAAKHCPENRYGYSERKS